VSRSAVWANLFHANVNGSETTVETKMYQQDAPPDNNTIVQHLFVLGIPSYDPRPVDQHVQGQLATAEEIEVASALLEEQRVDG
jgi:hypothetical protein